MKSSIKIDAVDLGEGRGLEPVIVVDIINTPDVRDKLLSGLFQSLGYDSDNRFLEIDLTETATTNDIGLPDKRKQIILSKPKGKVHDHKAVANSTSCSHNPIYYTATTISEAQDIFATYPSYRKLAEIIYAMNKGRSPEYFKKDFNEYERIPYAWEILLFLNCPDLSLEGLWARLPDEAKKFWTKEAYLSDPDDWYLCRAIVNVLRHTVEPITKMKIKGV